LRCTKLGRADGGSVMLAVPEQWPAGRNQAQATHVHTQTGSA
jgi:hypothetical protein